MRLAASVGDGERLLTAARGFSAPCAPAPSTKGRRPLSGEEDGDREDLSTAMGCGLYRLRHTGFQ